MRIVSLVPSLTELLFDLGLSEQVVGVTRFCIHPLEAKTKTKIGGTKTIKIERVVNLQPTLVIANKEENTKSDVEALQAHGLNVLVTDLNTLEDVYAFIIELGKLTSKTSAAINLVSNIQQQFVKLQKANATKVLYLIWHQPSMSVGTDTFIHYVMQLAGYKNVINTTRYPEVSDEEIIQLNPEYIFLSSEPYPFKQKHMSHFQRLLPHAKIALVDGEMFSWYGSRLLHTPKYLNELLKTLQ